MSGTPTEGSAADSKPQLSFADEDYVVRALDAIEKAEASAAAAACAPSRAGGLFRRFRLPFLGKKPAVAPVVEAAVETARRSRVDQPGSAAPQAGTPSLLTRAKSWIDPSRVRSPPTSNRSAFEISPSIRYAAMPFSCWAGLNRNDRFDPG